MENKEIMNKLEVIEKQGHLRFYILVALICSCAMVIIITSG